MGAMAVARLSGVMLLAVLATAFAMACAAASAPPTSPTQAIPPTAPRPILLDGMWNGRGSDSKGDTTVIWHLSQNGSSVTGTVTTQAINPADGSCNSCHRNKRGTFTGTIADTTLTIAMFFAAGANGDPTPECSATLTGSASEVAGNSITASYSGSDTCEGPFVNGMMTMTRGAAATSPRPARRD